MFFFCSPTDRIVKICHNIVIIIIIIINMKEWTLWSFPSPELQLLSPTFLRSFNCSSSLWSVVVWFHWDNCRSQFRLYSRYLLTPWSRVLLEKLTGFAASQEIPRILYFMEPESSIRLSCLICLWSVVRGVCTRWFKYDRDWFECKQAALRSSCAT